MNLYNYCNIKFKLVTIVLLVITNFLFAQLSSDCKLNIGTNISGVASWETNLQLVDIMKKCQEWHSQSIGDTSYTWDSGFAKDLSYRPDGYPTKIPQTVAGSTYPQKVAAIWEKMSDWPTGQYIVLYDGKGKIVFSGSIDSYQETSPGRIELNISDTTGIMEMSIDSSDVNDPIRNIRILLPGTEATYTTQPFYTPWLDRLAPFKIIRFMDWGHTNNWGQVDEYTIGPNEMVDWTARSKTDYYTYTHFKGVPYELMVKLLNDTDKDGWICVPHTASENYIRTMADYFRDNLESGRHLYIEYSNEIWNWDFGQTNWLYQYGCVETGMDWPEGIVPYIQNCMDYWTEEFAGQLDRITRVVAIQTSWLDVAQRVVNNMNPDSYDAIAATYYFGFSDQGESALDNLGASATVADIDFYARENWPTELGYIRSIDSLAKSKNKKLVFYEGGQSLLPNPEGETPSYAKALLDIQRAPEMYNLYNDWYDSIRTFQSGNSPLLLMNYSFVGSRSAEYGSWGILEYSNQDTSQIPAPKYKSTLENMNNNCSYILLQTKIFLEGTYNTSSHKMNTNLGSNIPTTSPYSEDPRTVNSIPADVVDWVLLQLRTTANGTTVTSHSAFLNKNGSIVADDGTSGEIVLNVPEGNYYIVIKHRNHLAVMSANTIPLNSTTSTLYDFTTGADKYYGTDAAVEVENGVWGMWCGDADGSGVVDAGDRNATWNNRNKTGYESSDVDMNAVVDAGDRNKSWNNRNRNTKIP